MQGRYIAVAIFMRRPPFVRISTISTVPPFLPFPPIPLPRTMCVLYFIVFCNTITDKMLMALSNTCCSLMYVHMYTCYLLTTFEHICMYLSVYVHTQTHTHIFVGAVDFDCS